MKYLLLLPPFLFFASCASITPAQQQQITGAAIGAATAAVASASHQLQTGKKIDQTQVALAATNGALQGLSATPKTP